MIVWHYTLEDRFTMIDADGVIVPATDGVEDAPQVAGREKRVQFRPGERPAVWFSKRPTWEPTATKGLIENGVRRDCTIAEMVVGGGGLVRIGVDASGMSTWMQHRKVGGIAPAMATALVKAGLDVGANPGDWYVRYGPVPRKDWISVERSADGIRWSQPVSLTGTVNP